LSQLGKILLEFLSFLGAEHRRLLDLSFEIMDLLDIDSFFTLQLDQLGALGVLDLFFLMQNLVVFGLQINFVLLQLMDTRLHVHLKFTFDILDLLVGLELLLFQIVVHVLLLIVQKVLLLVGQRKLSLELNLFLQMDRAALLEFLLSLFELSLEIQSQVTIFFLQILALFGDLLVAQSQ